MSSSANLSPVQFHGKTLFVATVNNQPFTSMRPIVEGMGMAWSPQRVKLTANAERWGVTMIVTPSEGGSQETLCMPLRKLPGWLMTINPKKVAPAIRETVTLYQDECDDALWDFWTKGEAVNKRKAAPKALPAPASRNTLDDYKALFKNLPESPQYWMDLLSRYSHAHEILGSELEAIKAEATRPFRVGRKSMVQTYFDASMSPMYSQQINIGEFDTPEEAALAYNEAAQKYHGEFAFLNNVPACDQEQAQQ